MAEDSGAFKTNPRNSAQFGHFVIARERRGKDASRRENGFCGAYRSHCPPILHGTDSGGLLYSGISRFAAAKAAHPSDHRVPLSPRPCGAPAKAELELMLPGFRFLFAAIVLSTSILIFGLGAAALLRAAHDQFASIPSRRLPPEPVFAQQIEPSAPTLALLRVEPIQSWRRRLPGGRDRRSSSSRAPSRAAPVARRSSRKTGRAQGR